MFSREDSPIATILVRGSTANFMNDIERAIGILICAHVYKYNCTSLQCMYMNASSELNNSGAK